MTHITTYQCNDLHRQRLYIPDLRAYLQREDSYLHIVKGTLLCICRRGAAQVKINYTTYNVQEGDLIAILPSHLFCFVLRTIPKIASWKRYFTRTNIGLRCHRR